MAIRQKTLVTIKLGGRSTSHSRSETNIRDLISVIDEPAERGGTNEGPSPTETAFASLIGCTSVIGQKCAAKLDVDIGTLDFEMEVDFDRRGVLLTEEIEVPFKAIRLKVTSNGSATEDQVQAVAEETAKYCPIAKLYQNAGTDLEVIWSTT